MPDGAHKGRFVQGFNAQIAVDSAAQMIVAAEVTQKTKDQPQRAPMLQQLTQNLGAKPAAASADAGYFSEEQVTDERGKDIALYGATGKQKHGEPDPAEPVVAEHSTTQEDSPRKRMKQKLQTEAGRALYKLRKAIVEPVFGQIKEWRGFRRFRFR